MLIKVKTPKKKRQQRTFPFLIRIPIRSGMLTFCHINPHFTFQTSKIGKSYGQENGKAPVKNILPLAV